MNPLRRLYHPTATFLILTRAASESAPTPLPTLTPQDHHDLCHFCDARGFGQGWAAHTLTLGDHATLLRDPTSNNVVAAAWLAARDFWVFEIGYTFRPAPDAVYLHGAFVAPSHRGQHLQRQLLETRLRHAAHHGKQFAHTILWEGNTPSLKNCQSQGFQITTRLTGLRIGPWQRDHLTPCHATLPAGQLVDTTNHPIAPTTWRRRYHPLRAPINTAA